MIDLIWYEGNCLEFISVGILGRGRVGRKKFRVWCGGGGVFIR